MYNGSFSLNTTGKANGWAFTKLDGSADTATATIVPRTDGRPGVWQQLVVGVGNSAQGARMYRQNGGTWTAGDQVYAECEIEMDADVANFGSFRLSVFPFTTSQQAPTV